MTEVPAYTNAGVLKQKFSDGRTMLCAMECFDAPPPLAPGPARSLATNPRAATSPKPARLEAQISCCLYLRSQPGEVAWVRLVVGENAGHVSARCAGFDLNRVALSGLL